MSSNRGNVAGIAALAAGAAFALGYVLAARRTVATSTSTTVTGSRGKDDAFDDDESPRELLSPAPSHPPASATAPIIVGIGGASGSGKSSLCQLIRKRIGMNSVLMMTFDAYYKGLSEGEDPAAHNFDEPAALDTDLLIEHLKAFKRGEPVHIPEYDFTTHRRLETTTLAEGASVIILDGIFTLYHKEIRDLCDLTIFTVEDQDTCLIRRLRRDLVERGRHVESVLTQYERFVKPGYNRFISPFMVSADIIVPNARDNTRAQEVVVYAVLHEMGVLKRTDKSRSME